MLRHLISSAAFLGLGIFAAPALAQPIDASPVKAGAAKTGFVETGTAMPSSISPSGFDPDYCINRMAEFPADNHEVRYQFFRLTEEMAREMTPDLRKALHKYGDKATSANRPLLEAIEDIANPVLRQAAPDITVANMTHVIDFATLCKTAITGQIESLRAFDPALNDVKFNAVIVEDALFLRQVLSDSLFRLGADKDPLYLSAVNQYAAALVTTRDQVEFTSFEAELDDLEAVFMKDLDGRLKRSNDIINNEMDRQVLNDSVALSDSMNKAEKEKAKQQQLYTLSQILGGRR
jgi:hypothetical protein